MARLKSILWRSAGLLLSRTPSCHNHLPQSDKPSWGWTPALALISSGAVYLASLAAEFNRHGYNSANFVFYASVACFMLPIACRLLWPTVSRWERISLLLLATFALFLMRTIHEPISFVDHDAFLHWATTNDILVTGRLFHPNPLLPISAVYPGLEITASALVSLSGLSVFAAAQMIMLVVRVAFICGLFLVYERLADSSRIAALATIIYMGASSFVFFDTMFSYGSLALTFMVLVLLADIRADEGSSWRVIVLLALPILAALAVTHHLTAFITLLLLSSFALLEIVRRGWTDLARILVIPAAAILLTTGWSIFVGNPSEGYLAPVFENAITESARFLSFDGGRLPFVAEDGTVAPAWQRIVTLLSVLLICVGLATSFFRSLAHAGVPVFLERFPRRMRDALTWHNSRLVVLTLVTFGYPLSIVLRMTRAGWEVGNRIGPFAFLGVGIVIAIGIATYWQGSSTHRLRTGVLGAIAAIGILAGIFSGSGNYILGSNKYRVSADSASVEPMAVGAADWSQQWLGPGNRFFADRTNRLLLATYGAQQVITTLYDKYDLGEVVLAEKVGLPELQAMRETDVDYLMLDLRLTDQLPLIGWYFDPGPVFDEPPEPSVFFKFSKIAGVSRVFDNGYISIVDVTKFRDVKYAD